MAISSVCGWLRHQKDRLSKWPVSTENVTVSNISTMFFLGDLVAPFSASPTSGGTRLKGGPFFLVRSKNQMMGSLKNGNRTQLLASKLCCNNFTILHTHSFGSVIAMKVWSPRHTAIRRSFGDVMREAFQGSLRSALWRPPHLDQWHRQPAEVQMFGSCC